jgi:hypothetical protein
MSLIFLLIRNCNNHYFRIGLVLFWVLGIVNLTAILAVLPTIPTDPIGKNVGLIWTPVLWHKLNVQFDSQIWEYRILIIIDGY